MANISKSYAVALAHQAVAHPATVVGSALDVSTKLGVTLYLFHAAVESAQENTNPGKFLIQTSGEASGNESWATAFEVDATISTPATEAMDAAEGIGETSLAVTLTAGFVAGDKLYVQDVTTLANSEWGLCREIVTDTSIDLVDGLTNAKEINDVIWNDADIWTPIFLDLTGIGRVRVLFMHEGAVGANCHIKALATYGDSIA